jgi:hypothetical protein
MRSLQVVVSLVLLAGLNVCEGKAVKIHGYVTSIASPTSFDIEDFKITCDQTLTLEFDKTDAEEQADFRPEDISVGTELQVKGAYDEQTGVLKASEVKVFLRETKRIRREALLDAKTILENTGDGSWKGIIRADGQHIRVDQGTQVSMRQNKSERKQAKAIRKKHEAGQSPGEESEQSVPFRGGEIDPNFFVKYEGRRESNGTIFARKVELRRSEVEAGEERLWKSVNPKVKPSSYVSGKPGELIIRGVGKYKLVPNEEAQAYVQQLSLSLIPAFQKALPPGDRDKIPFQCFVTQSRVPNAFALPNGTLVIHSGMFDVLENEGQLAAVLSHEIAHATEKHQWREREFQKKKRIALQVGAAVAAAYGKYNLSDMLRMIDGAIRNGYSRYLENQADRVGMEYMTEAGYDARQAPRVWKVMTQRIGDQHTNFFWSSHDNNTTRRSYLMAELKNNYADAKFDSLKTDSDEFQKVKTAIAGGTSTKRTVKVRLRAANAASGESAIPVTAPTQPKPAATFPIQAPAAAVSTAPTNGLVEVTFTANPPGALVSFSGMAVAYTPCVLKLQAQMYRVKMRLAGYEDWTGEITVGAGKPSAVVAQMQRTQ